MAKSSFLAIFYNFRISSKNLFFQVLAGSWGPGVVLNRLGMLKNHGGLNFSSGARSWSSFVDFSDAKNRYYMKSILGIKHHLENDLGELMV